MEEQQILETGSVFVATMKDWEAPTVNQYRPTKHVNCDRQLPLYIYTYICVCVYIYIYIYIYICTLDSDTSAIIKGQNL